MCVCVCVCVCVYVCVGEDCRQNTSHAQDKQWSAAKQRPHMLSALLVTITNNIVLLCLLRHFTAAMADSVGVKSCVGFR